MLLSILYDWGGLNRDLFFIVNGIRGPFVDAFMLAGTQLGDVWNACWIVLVLMLLILARRASSNSVIGSLLPDVKRVSEALPVFVGGCMIAGLLVWGAKTGFNMPRPYAALPIGSVTVLTTLKEPYSFPSGHAAFAMLVAWIFWPYCLRRWRFVLALSVVWVGVSRVSVGAHFPADVLAGYLCGALGAWLAVKAMSKYSGRRLRRG